MRETPESSYDVVIVGSGINSLVCAALLARSGQSVLVLERSDRPGGCIRSEELTLPGFTHDVLSAWHPLFVLSPAYAELGDELHTRGLKYLNTETPTGSIAPGGRAAVLHTTRAETVKSLDAFHVGDGTAYQKSLHEIEASAEITFGLLGSELRRFSTIRLLWREFRRLGLHALIEFFGTALGSCRSWLSTSFRSEEAKNLFAPWVFHTGLSPDDAISGHMGKVIAFSLESAGMPVVQGGSEGLVAAFRKLIEDYHGEILCDADAAAIEISNGRATTVRLEDGRRFHARRNIVCSVTPTQLYGRLIADLAVSDKVCAEAASFRYGRSDMQIHLALSSPPSWIDSSLDTVPMVHVTEGLDSIAASIASADAGYLPSKPTLVVGQPTAVDPSRAPEGKWILWIQLQELPPRVKGDSLGEIVADSDGEWNQELAESYADRVIERLTLVIPDLPSLVLDRKVLSPRDIESLNMNLVGGDPYSGDCRLDQFFAWRPLSSSKNHETEVPGLMHIGASTHPGPGLGGGSGYLVGKLLGG